MEQVWIVFHDSGPDNNILGVFNNGEDAEAYAAEVSPEWEKGALTTCLPVPWRSTDQRTPIQI